MQGLMQYHPLMISSAIEFAATYHADAEIVSRRVEGDIHRTTYAEVNRRAKRVANAFDAWASRVRRESERWRGTGIGTLSCTTASRGRAGCCRRLVPCVCIQTRWPGS